MATWNIHKGVGRDRRRDLARTASVIGEIAPDIMALQEADARFGSRQGLLNLEALAREHGLVPVPMPVVTLAHGWHGNVLLLRQSALEALHRIRLPGLEPRGALIADLIHQGKPLRVVCTHLGLLGRSRVAQARYLTGRLAELDVRSTVLMGDLNEWRRTGSAAITHLEGQFPRVVAVPSFPARYPMLPLDRIMASGTVHLSQGALHDTPIARIASDHLPVKARLHLAG